MNLKSTTLQTVTLLASFALTAGCTGPATDNEPPAQSKTQGETRAALQQSPEEAEAPSPGSGPRPPLPAKMEEGMGSTIASAPAYLKKTAPASGVRMAADLSFMPYPSPRLNTESYTPFGENRFINSVNDPLSTFSIDVDTASYANIRRFINSGSLPPVGAVRIEEMVNYFSYTYPQPESDPFSVTAELGPSPWNPDYNLVKIGLQGKDLSDQDLPPSNLVFLIDVSGSMNHPDKLPLLQKSMLMLVDQLSARDRVSIVVYAGADRVVLQPTPGTEKDTIRKAIDSLTSGGSTHGSSGIMTAYAMAEQVYMPNGNNRVILASDGDFNVGITSRGELEKLITEKRESGVYLTVLGFGTGNFHDDTMEILADKGNGNYAYIDSLLEAKKVLIKERASTLHTLAKDVKIQVEFNPAVIGAYRLIGYENRMLADEDFKDDLKDAGEVGVGHTVTALYELIPTGHPDIPQVDGLKYRKTRADDHAPKTEAMTVKLRYKPLGRNSSIVREIAVRNQGQPLEKTSDDFRFAAAVAGFGMLIKNSPHLGKTGYEEILTLARSSRGNDDEGYRAEFIRLVETAQLLQR